MPLLYKLKYCLDVEVKGYPFNHAMILKIAAFHFHWKGNDICAFHGSKFIFATFSNPGIEAPNNI